MSDTRLQDLLAENPAVANDEELIREVLASVRRLRREGFGGEGYRLVPPFGDKRRLRPDDGLASKLRAISAASEVGE
jgi:hypothetical protein